MSDINIGQLSEAINDKCDRDMMNVDNTSGADAVVEYQEPTSANNYTWYRKYKSGWVEQGGQTQNATTVSLPITMADTNYFTFIAYNKTTNTSNVEVHYISANVQNTTNFTIPSSSIRRVWRVEGMSA